MTSNEIMARHNLHRIWIAGKKNVSEMGPQPKVIDIKETISVNSIATSSLQLQF